MKNKILPTLLLVLIFTISLNAATFTVNSTNDGVDANVGDNVCQTATLGECTLRAAIGEANFAAGIDSINFNISGAGVKTILPNSILPDIIQPLTIDGYTQPGASVNTALTTDNAVILIEIDGTNAGAGANGFVLLGNFRLDFARFGDQSFRARRNFAFGRRQQYYQRQFYRHGRDRID